MASKGASTSRREVLNIRHALKIWGIAILEFRFNLRFSRRRFQHRIVFAFFVDPGAADINIVKESARSCAGLRRGVTLRERATVSVWAAHRCAEDSIARARGKVGPRFEDAFMYPKTSDTCGCAE